jgi:excisionase family DNA binding protein
MNFASTHDHIEPQQLNVKRVESRGFGQREYFVDAAAAAKFLGLNRRTLMKMARDGVVPAHPLGEGARKMWRFLLSELDEWLRSRINSARRPCSSFERRH